MEKAAFGLKGAKQLEETLRATPGVTQTSIVFMRPDSETPEFLDADGRETGAAPVLLIEYDEKALSYEDLLQSFWESHDPTERQAKDLDAGNRYRTAIFTFSDAQAEAAEIAKKALTDSGKYNRPIATLIEPAATFYTAGEASSQYLEKGEQPRGHI